MTKKLAIITPFLILCAYFGWLGGIYLLGIPATIYVMEITYFEFTHKTHYEPRTKSSDFINSSTERTTK